jgi:short-subunit dehydrogenase
LNGHVALITGASSGIGEALARELAARGVSLTLIARREDKLETLAQELSRTGVRVLVRRGDVNEEHDLTEAVRATIAAYGKLDLVIANAGFGVAGNFEKLSLEDYRRQFETNVFGTLRTIQASLPELIRSKGRLALIGSVAGYIAVPGNSAYAMSKFAVRALAESIHGELKPRGVSVTLISPGFVTSEIRKVDNRGALHESAPDPIPHWLRMPAGTAARKIVRAIEKRKREEIITAHGKVLVFVRRFFPWVYVLAASRGARSRPEPKGDAPRDKRPGGPGADLH